MRSIDIPNRVINAVKKFIEGLEKRGFHIEQVYLFGSYAKGTWIKTSDIDLVVISSDFKNIPFSKRLDIVNEVVWKEGIDPYIEALPYTPEELKIKIIRSIVLADASKYWISLSKIIFKEEAIHKDT